MRWVKPSFLLGLLIFLNACQQPIKSSEPATVREQEPVLSQTYARWRATKISDVHYDLSITLSDEKTDFHGDVKTQFKLSEPVPTLTVDFNGGEISSLQVNGQNVQWLYNSWFITLDGAFFNPGENTIRIAFKRPYSNDGDGLHRYQDPKTNNVYLYTNFEPYNANKLFPHFDQPNIKASYSLDVVAPSAWQVVSATRETRILNGENNRHWFFPKTDKIPSYIFPLHAGPYTVWEQTYEDEHGTIPMRLFARQELAPFVVKEDWFSYTTDAFKFFNDYFEYPYPYKKYDQIIVPDFNAGAMENLAAVTFTEWYVKRGKKTQAERARIAYVVAHELAHMWFGNLVTMDWWNGLWLNESFATYMGYLQQAEASEFKGVWQTFYERTKQGAYAADQLSTTHAIELPVNTTAEAFSNFDSITYGKGASVLKQLPHFIGPENFQKGVAQYIRTHATGNTTLADFTGALAKASDMELSTWTDEWLHTAGLNTIQVNFDCEEDVLTKLHISQSAGEQFPTLRSQKVNVALFSVDQKAKLITQIPVTYAGELTNVAIKDGTACPDLIYPNYDDWAYVKVLLDEKSKDVFANNLFAFKRSIFRAMLWQTLWDAVLDGEMSLLNYIEVVTKNISAEKSTRIASNLARNLVDSAGYLWLIERDEKTYSVQKSQIAIALWQSVLASAPGSDRQIRLFDQWQRVVHTPEDLNKVAALLNNELQVDGLKLDQDRRWYLVEKLSEHAWPNAETIVEQELKRDSSERGLKNVLGAEASQPQLTVKQRWLNELLNPNSEYKLSELREVMRNLYPPQQRELIDATAEQVLAALETFNNERELRFIKRYVQYMLPMTCSEHSVTRLQNALAKKPDNPLIQRALREAIEEDQRCITISMRL